MRRPLRTRRQLMTALGIAATGVALAGASPALAAPPDVALTFDAPVAGTVTDKDGQGTGFTGVQANTAGNQHVPANLDLAGGLLTVTTTAGDGTQNTQQNALQVTVDGTADYTVETTFDGPLGFSETNQSAGIFVGAGQNDYVKLVARKTATGSGLQLAREIGGSFLSVATPGSPTVLTAGQVTLRLQVDAGAGTVSGSYSIDGGPFVAVGTVPASGVPDAVTSASAQAGIVHTHFTSGQAVTPAYDDFSVQPTPASIAIGATPKKSVLHGPAGSGGLTIPGFGSFNGGTLPTSIAFGPDDRLYVATQYGKIYVVTMNAQDQATGLQGTITAIADRPNTNFDGSPAPGVTGRQVTGIAFGPDSTAANPVLYVSHSDPRIFKNEQPGQSLVDEQSGVVTKLTLNAAGAVTGQQDLVTGLPRSAENHSVNGMDFGPDGWLYLGVGGATNFGAPSLFFGYFPEVPLSAAVLRINPAAIGGGTVDASAGSAFTFTDPCGPGESVGNGCSAATNVPGGPGAGTVPGKLEVYGTGFRNPYDLVWHSNGKLYANENEGNSGGGLTPGGQDPGAGGDPPDELFDVQQGGYHGHPNPSIGETGYDDGVQAIADYAPNSSTTGITEYTQNLAGGALKGQLLSTNYAQGDTLERLVLSADGATVLEKQVLASDLSDPLDVTVRSNGTIFVAEHGFAGDSFAQVSSFQPVAAACDTDDPAGDADGDGYSNADEAANGTGPCNPADVPDDADGDKVSDLNDPDDDNDGIPDVQDDLQLDPTNGAGTQLPFTLDFNTSDAGGFFGTGFLGAQLSSKGGGPLKGNASAGGGGGFMQLKGTPGTNEGAANSQHNALQQGFRATAPFTVSAVVGEPFQTGNPEGREAGGIFFGPGEDAFVRLAVQANGGSPRIELGVEQGGSFSSPAGAALPLPQSTVTLYLDGDPSTRTVRARYRLGQGAVQTLGSVAVPEAWFASARGGVVATASGSSKPQATFVYDQFSIGAGEALPPAPGAGGGGTTTAVCATVAARPAPGGGSGGRVRLSPGQLFINQRISQAAVRRANAVQGRLDRRIRAEDICGHSLGAGAFGSTVGLTAGGAAQAADAAKPEAIPVGRRKAGGGPGRVTLTERQLLINQRISQAAVRRANALQARLDAGLTGGDVADGAITAGKLVPGLVVANAAATGAQPARTVTRPAPARARSARVTVSARQLRINQRISQAAVRRTNALIDRLERGLTAADFRPGTLTGYDLSPDQRR
ncbi:MAG: PQQ-dependent sugar dehydrogenase [Thermoleophilia bacterium]